jgi:hypothetical protein
MPEVPMLVKKGALLRKIDERLAHPKREFLEELERMAKEDRLSDLAIDRRHGTLDRGGKHHADVEWFGEGDGWWPELRDKEKKIRWAYIQALRLATRTEPARAIRTFWIAGVPETFQCYVHDAGDAGVMVFWVTPAAPEGQQSPAHRDARRDLWVVGDRDEIGAVLARYPEDFEVERPVECEEGIFLFEATGY